MADVKPIDGLLRAMGAATLVALLSGCTTQAQQSEEDQVAARALEWANALIELDYDRALTYMTPTYQNSPRAERFRGDFSGSGFWLGAELKWVRCEEGEPVRRCEVRLILTVQKPPEMRMPMPIPYDTTWLLVKGQWYQYRD